MSSSNLRTPTARTKIRSIEAEGGEQNSGTEIGSSEIDPETHPPSVLRFQMSSSQKTSSWPHGDLAPGKQHKENQFEGAPNPHTPTASTNGESLNRQT
jgi:hypothetical protein